LLRGPRHASVKATAPTKTARMFRAEFGT
jgi:hypothetical protein